MLLILGNAQRVEEPPGLGFTVWGFRDLGFELRGLGLSGQKPSYHSENEIQSQRKLGYRGPTKRM